jgi:alkylation response protein AidB-like acyl-CoA dehydrogenase
MQAYAPPIDDYAFLLKHVFAFEPAMAELYPNLGMDADLAVMVLAQAGRFCSEVLQPINLSGDQIGAKLRNGAVVTAPGFAEAYAAFLEAGWASLSGPPAYGGQGLPRVLQFLMDEMMSATNVSFGLFPGLTRGAIEALEHHGDEPLKSIYLQKMVTGEWSGVMALTEASAGSDLSMLKCQAAPLDDGSYVITGTKIFISSGDHDFGGNIVHLVLARLPDAPPGVKGISLFLAPKFLVGPNGELGERNTLSVGSLEHKMGIHAQPTCVMNYDAAKGWLVGQPNRGLQAMFTMMNAERLFVGMQGLGLAGGAYQQAAGYAKERLQGRSADGAKGSAPIIEHADVRRMLLTIRSFVEGGRALAVWAALQLDTAAEHPDADRRARADGLVALLTPVIKAAFTDLGFESTVLAQQVFGGHGYIREWGVEQFVRDARIAQIYEGTNGIQALDLVSRKLRIENGQLVERFFAEVVADLAAVKAAGGADDIADAMIEALERLKIATATLQSASSSDAGAAACDYLRMFALVALGWMWARMACAAVANGDAIKPTIARFFVGKLLPQSLGLAQAIMASSESLSSLAPEAF